MARSMTRPPFDRDADFVIARPFLLSGVNMQPGQRLDKTLVTVRRHRQLYDKRLVEQGNPPVTMPEVETVMKVPPPAEKTYHFPLQDGVQTRRKKKRRSR